MLGRFVCPTVTMATTSKAAWSGNDSQGLKDRVGHLYKTRRSLGEAVLNNQYRPRRSSTLGNGPRDIGDSHASEVNGIVLRVNVEITLRTLRAS